MRFFIDECCSRHLIDYLEALGHDALHVADWVPSTADPLVAAFAVASDRILITADYGIMSDAVRGAEPLGGMIMLSSQLRLWPVEDRDSRALHALRVYGEMKGWLTIVEADRYRRRRLPQAVPRPIA